MPLNQTKPKPLSELHKRGLLLKFPVSTKELFYFCFNRGNPSFEHLPDVGEYIGYYQ